MYPVNGYMPQNITDRAGLFWLFLQNNTCVTLRPQTAPACAAHGYRQHKGGFPSASARPPRQHGQIPAPLPGKPAAHRSVYSVRKTHASTSSNPCGSAPQTRVYTLPRRHRSPHAARPALPHQEMPKFPPQEPAV